MSIKRKGYEKDKRAAGDKGDKGLGVDGLWVVYGEERLWWC